MKSRINNENTLLRTDISKRIYGLDILRAIAILQVLLIHSIDYIPQNLVTYISTFVMYDGVSIFFVLSGFLIGGILINTATSNGFNRKALVVFWMNRWLRTLPLYYLILILIFIIAYALNSSAPSDLGLKQFYYLFFLQNFNWPVFPFFEESWSLCIEEWFYFFIPITFFLLLNFIKLENKKAFLITILFYIIFPLVYRYIKYINLDAGIEPVDGKPYFTFEMLARLDGIVYGVLGAYLMFYYNKLWKKYRILCFVLAAFLIVIVKYPMENVLSIEQSNLYYNVFYFAIIGWSILLLLPFFYSIKKGKGLLFKSLTFISLISYSLYIIHKTLIHSFFVSQLHVHIYVKFILLWGLSITIAALLYKYFEKPIIDSRKIIINKFIRS